MTVADQIKTLDDKSKSNQAQYDLDRETAKMFELQSKNLDKDESLTGGNLGYKPRVLEKTKFKYSPLGMSLNKPFKKMRLEILLRKTKVISVMIITIPFLNCTKGMMSSTRCHQILRTIG